MVRWPYAEVSDSSILCHLLQHLETPQLGADGGESIRVVDELLRRSSSCGRPIRRRSPPGSIGLVVRFRRRKPTFCVLAGGARCAVAGESHYQSALASTVALCKPDLDHRRVFDARLIPDLHNKYDENAVGVYSDAGLVGHLARADAAAYRPVFDELMRRGYGGGSCEAELRGGEDAKEFYGVVLRLSIPRICLDELPEPE